MRILLVVLVLASCCGILLVAPAGAAPLVLTTLHTPSTGTSPGTKPGTYDPYVGKGDLLTKAVPVCCCSLGFCEDAPPNGPCAGGPGFPTCHCNAFGNACIHS